MDFIQTAKVIPHLFLSQQRKLCIHFSFLDFPSLKLYLDLSGDVETKHYTTQGYYLLAESNLNGYPYWIQQYGDNAIWLTKSWYSGWTVGHEDYLGQDYSGIIGPNEIFEWPSLISDGFKYWNGAVWKTASSNLIIFEECKC